MLEILKFKPGESERKKLKQTTKDQLDYEEEVNLPPKAAQPSSDMV